MEFELSNRQTGERVGQRRERETVKKRSPDYDGDDDQHLLTHDHSLAVVVDGKISRHGIYFLDSFNSTSCAALFAGGKEMIMDSRHETELATERRSGQIRRGKTAK